MRKNIKNEKGFTLIELIIVIAILAIIAAVAIPNIVGAVESSRKSADIANAKVILNAAGTVQAKYEDLSTIAAGDYDVTFATPTYDANGVPTNFVSALILEINGDQPEPKFKGDDGTTNLATADRFILTVAGNGGMSVHVASATATLAEVSPDTNAVYE